MKRRDFILAGTAAALPAAPALPSTTPFMADRDRLIQIIEQLEARQSWESSCVVAEKSFAAWQFRKALGLSPCNSAQAQLHIEYQRLNFDAYTSSQWAEHDRNNGINLQISSFERTLT